MLYWKIQVCISPWKLESLYGCKIKSVIDHVFTMVDIVGVKLNTMHSIERERCKNVLPLCRGVKRSPIRYSNLFVVTPISHLHVNFIFLQLYSSSIKLILRK